MDELHKQALKRLGEKLPGVTQLSEVVARNTVQRLLGFWVMWHIAGGFNQLIWSGMCSQTGTYRQRNEFRRVFGVEVEDFWPEVANQIPKTTQEG